MFSISKGSTGRIAGICMAIILGIIPLVTGNPSDHAYAEPVALASVALILLCGVRESIGVSQSMETIWVSSEKQWNDLVESSAAEMNETLPEPAPDLDVDFSQYGILLIRMGAKPNNGYSLTLTADEAIVENREAKILTHWGEPEPDGIYFPAFVYPYLAIKMEKGAFDNIAVIDQNDAVMMRLSIDLKVIGFKLVERKPTAPGIYDYVVRAIVENQGGAADNVTAVLTGWQSGATATSGQTLSFGRVESGATAMSTNTFTIRLDMTTRFDDSKLVLCISY